MSSTNTNNLLNSHFSNQITTRVFPPKKPSKATSSTTQEPPKKLSKSFQRQLAKTLATPGKKNKFRKKQLATNAKRRATTAANRKQKDEMSKRAAPQASSEAGNSSKKAKTTALPEMEKDKEGQPYWEISGKRRLQLSEFKGTTMIGVREFYEKDGEALPGKKGISMTVEQFDTIVRLLPQLERELKGKGLALERPDYEGAAEASGGKDEEEEDDAEGKEGEEEEEDVKDESGTEG